MEEFLIGGKIIQFWGHIINFFGCDYFSYLVNFFGDLTDVTLADECGYSLLVNELTRAKWLFSIDLSCIDCRRSMS